MCAWAGALQSNGTVTLVYAVRVSKGGTVSVRSVRERGSTVSVCNVFTDQMHVLKLLLFSEAVSTIRCKQKSWKRYVCITWYFCALLLMVYGCTWYTYTEDMCAARGMSVRYCTWYMGARGIRVQTILGQRVSAARVCSR